MGKIDFSGNCVASMIEAETCPAARRCVIRSAGDSSWCETCGHRFDTNTRPDNEPPNEPPACRLELDPFRGGLLT